MHVEHLLVDLLGRHAPAEHARAGEVAAVARVGGAHHVLRVELLLGQLRHREGAVLLRAARRERREADHEEVEAREGHHVHRELAQVAVELAREAERAGGAADGRRDEVVEVTVGRGGELEGGKQMSYRASLSRAKHWSEFSTRWWTESVALYGSTTVS